MELNDKTVKIKVEKLRKCFGDLEVLRDISTEIHEGEVVVILGPSGSGKSTFLLKQAGDYDYRKHCDRWR